MELKKVKDPGPMPKGRAGTRIDWTPLKNLQVGEALDVPDEANLTSVAVQVSKLHKSGTSRYRRQGRRIWRVS